MSRKLGVLAVIAVVSMTLFAFSAFATDAQIYFSSDKNGQNRVTNIQEGDEIWIVVVDDDENIDCDVRDKIWTDVKLFDPKTGAYIAWVSYFDEHGNGVGQPGDPLGQDFQDDDYVPYKGHSPGPTAGWLGGDYLEETGADTGVFVSKRAFQVGTRENFDEKQRATHVVCNSLSTVPFEPGEASGGAWLSDFVFGGFFYVNDIRRVVGDDLELDDLDDDYEWDDVEEETMPYDVINGNSADESNWMVGRFENMDTLIGMYQDQNDETDIAVAMMKIVDAEATISWDQEMYKDANSAATITIVDPDENLNCNQVEWVPVFVLVNPGSWNPMEKDSPTNFCMLLRSGGVDTDPAGDVYDYPIRWYNIYHSFNDDGRYYVQYDPQVFATADHDGVTPVSFYAQETGVNTGVFQLNLNSILTDLEFEELRVRDVLVAYYIDPNDYDDFKLATAYIEERQHSITSFTDASRADKDLYWIGRDPVYVQVIDANANVDPCCPEQVLVHVCDPHGEDDAEWLILDETSSNSPVFFTFAGTQLWPVWDALGVGLAGARGGFQLQLDNWKIEAFNEDDIYARYNDVYYENDVLNAAANEGIGDLDIDTSFPPHIARFRVPNDVSFDLMSVADTQVYDGSDVSMYFLDRQGNRVSGYVNSDCVFIEVLDPDQDEDQYRRERIDGYWDGGQGGPIAPMSLNDWGCEVERRYVHDWNRLFGDTNIFGDAPADSGRGVRYDTVNEGNGDIENAGWGKLYVANPRNGRWAAVDLLETGPATGDFVSVICIDLTSVYECVPTLGVIPGDTIVAFYQDPSNHSDSAMISVKVGIGGGGTPPAQQSTTMFVDAGGHEVANYTDADMVYVKVIDPSHAAGSLTGALTVEGQAFDLASVDGEPGVFMTEELDLGLTAGDSLTAEYTDPTDLTDTSADTITVIASVLVVDNFYAGPNPFEIEVTFGFNGTGVASQMTVCVYDLAGGMVYETTQTDVSKITWDGLATSGEPLANGCYIYTIVATDGTNTFEGSGKVFVNR